MQLRDYIFFTLPLLFLVNCSKTDEAVKTDESVTTAETITKEHETKEPPLFELIPPGKSKVTFNDNGRLLYPGDLTGLYSNISGTAVGDINNDGLPDLFFSGGRGNSRLYLNLGNFRFQDITASAGIRDANVNNADNQGVNMVDINGDGWLDIYILKTGITGNFQTQEFNKDGANLLYINQKDNTFKEQASTYGLDIIGLSHTANFFDYDGDGDLDVYMIQTGEPGSAFNFSYYEAPPRSKWLSDLFLENQAGKFVDVTIKSGLPNLRSVGLSVSVGDVNNDGFSDIYVANDFFGPDFFYINNGDRTFTKSLNDYFTKTPMSAMGSDFADINNDGWIDLFVGEMMPSGSKRQKLNLVPFSIEIYNKLEEQGNPQYARNMLQINQGGTSFRDIGFMADVFATEWSWSSFFFDADNDGFKDLFVANGILRDMTNMDFVKNNFGKDYTKMADPQAKSQVNPGKAPSVSTNNYIFKNQNGYQFSDKSQVWGLGQKVHTRGATYADLDADGDLDLVVNNIKQSPYLYKNLAVEQGGTNFLKLMLSAKGENTFGIGATINLYYKGLQQTTHISNQRGFQSCPEPVAHFGLDSVSTIDTLVVRWPGGLKEAWFNISSNQTLKLNQGEGTPFKTLTNAKEKKLLTTRTNLVQYNHREKSFNDYRSQRLLVRQYSQEGPGIAVGDIDGDGLDDFYIGGAHGSTGQLFVQNRNGSFKASSIPVLETSEDMGCVFFTTDPSELPRLYIANGSNELTTTGSLADQLFNNEGEALFTSSDLSLPQSSASIVTAADYDGDGDQDLFVGGRVTPGNFSAVPASHLLRNDGNSFTDVTTEIAPELSKIGRVTAAIWTDYNNDDQLELAVVGEWMPLTLFIQQSGKFKAQEVPNSEGWWNSITGADIDNDGDVDYIAGNHGLNSPFKASKNEPVTLICGDFDKNGQQDPLVFKYTDGINAPFVNRDIFTSHMPAYNNTFYSFSQYADATFNTLFDEQALSNASINEVYELQSCVFVNKGDGSFELRPLPIQAQSAPMYGLLTLDINEDGIVDLLSTGGSYSNHYEYGSIDALGGLLMLGNGDGSFKAVPASKSGFQLGKAGRALSLIYHGKSAHPLILAANNNGPLEVFEWTTTSKIVEAPDNAAYAILRLKNGKQQRQEFYTGGGYLSQSSRVVVNTKAVEEIEFK
jgi:hypothetical protein